MNRVLIVERDPALQRSLAAMIERMEGMTLAGSAQSREEALRMVSRYRPAVIALNGADPELKALDFVRAVMGSMPVPIVLYVAGKAPSQEAVTGILNEGAVACVDLRGAPLGSSSSSAEEELGTLLLTMAGVKLVKRWNSLRRSSSGGQDNGSRGEGGESRVVAIGASTGGPVAIQKILSQLPANFPIPILVVQHIAPGFLPNLVHWLQASSELVIKIAEDHEALQPGTVYFAPDGFHLGLGPDVRAALCKPIDATGIFPAVSYLFRSVLDRFGGRSACVLLTGMGRDGAEELLQLRRAGALTIAQDKASCVVYGMPAEAARLDAAVHTCPPERMPQILMSWSCQTGRDAGANKRGGV